jgi:hypothetical protein
LENLTSSAVGIAMPVANTARIAPRVDDFMMAVV